MLKATLNTDGGSRGNPGPAGFGFSLTDAVGSEIACGGWFLPQATNNVAEYQALIWGLQNAKEARVTDLTVLMDSELIVKQMQGAYKVKSEDLKPLFLQAKSLFSTFPQATISHVYRTENVRADELANQAMDAQGAVGSYLCEWGASQASLFDLNVVSSDLPKATEDTLFSEALDQNVVRTATVKEEQHMEKNTTYTGPHHLTGETYEQAGGHYEMTVKDHFDAAHTLPGYDGECRYLHGHTWDVEATIAGEHLDSTGIMYDFKTVKKDLHAVLDNFDHRYINDIAPFDILNPTAEHLARVIFYELEKTFPAGVVLKEIAIWESPTAKIVYRP